MNDEIKEKIKAYYVGNDIDKIIDYITNLQQENKRLKLKYKSQKDINQKLLSIDIKHKKINGELREENSKLEIALQNIQEDYNSRIEQINYLNEELGKEKRIEEENERLKETIKEITCIPQNEIEVDYE